MISHLLPGRGGWSQDDAGSELKASGYVKNQKPKVVIVSTVDASITFSETFERPEYCPYL